jgi:uncharacterized protein YdbL (DUF1318 family)
VVAGVNAERRRLYEQRAKDQNVSIDAVGTIYASQILGKLPPGAYFRTPEGSYIRK